MQNINRLILLNKNNLIIFTISTIVFTLSALGLFDSLSAEVSKLLYHTFGYTNKWSRSYGEPWFVNLNSNLSAFGSREIVLLVTVFFSVYLFKDRGKVKALNFLYTTIGAIILILFIKSITSDIGHITFKTIITESLSNFPSGHTFIATVLYLGIAKALNSRSRSASVNRFIFVSAILLIFIVGVSRVTGSGHTVTEVIAGWSLGLAWISLSELFLKFKL